jgi:hypothetical protein
MPEITFLSDLEEKLREIAERDARAPARSPRQRRRFVLAVSAALAAIAVVALVAADPFASSSSRLVAAARAATVPPSVIEHVVTVTEQVERGTVVSVRDELWTASGEPLGSRVVIDNPAYGGVIERAEAEGVSSSFDATSGVIYERTLPANWVNLDATRVPEDLTFVRRALEHQTARDMGPTTLDGQPVQRFDYGSRETTGQSCSYYATREDYVPVAVDCTNLLRHPWLHARITYDFRERTAANDALLSIRAQHPGAAVDRAPITDCDLEPHYYGPGVSPDFADDPRNAPCGHKETGG